jgi:spermidine dehydrogenase
LRWEFAFRHGWEYSEIEESACYGLPISSWFVWRLRTNKRETAMKERKKKKEDRQPDMKCPFTQSPEKIKDHNLGMSCPISRRDFLNGVAITAAVGLMAGEAALGSALTTPSVPPLGKGADASAEEALLAQGIKPSDPRYYPPILSQMRGNHPGSFEVPHATRDGDFWSGATKPEETGESYDLVVVGGGISGLAAAYFFRAHAGPSARILILDNHDDFGGHAKRNEFHIGGRMLLMNGGTMGIESPFDYSAEAAGLFRDLGIDPPALQAKCAKPGFYNSMGLEPAVFFDRETFGVDRLVVGEPGGYYGRRHGTAKNWDAFLQKSPLSPEVRSDIVRIETGDVDYMKGLTELEKKQQLAHMSYKDYLLKIMKVHPGVIPYYQTSTWGLYGVGIDAVSALDLWAEGRPGFQGLGLKRVPEDGFLLSFTASGGVAKDQKPYHFHYPDGNASVARLLTRSLVPGAAPGHTAEDIVTAKFDYSRLDRSGNQVRIRLNSPVVRTRHAGDPATAHEVEVAYAQHSKVYSVRGKLVVLACYNTMIPFLCPQLPSKQKQALLYAIKVPLIYTTVAIKNWKAFEKLGIQNVSCPGMYHNSVSLNSVVDIGDYTSPKSPDEPILLHMLRTPCRPGLSARDQQEVGRYELFRTSFEMFERQIRQQLGRVLGPGGFNPAQDIAAITVNRWSHGYAYEYTPLWDPAWPPGQQPCEIGRKRFGRIAIANSDAAAAAYTDQAINQAYRAVNELLALEGHQTADTLATTSAIA